MLPTPAKPLSVAAMRSALPGDILRDADIPGLHLRVFPGKSVYYVHYRSPTERKPNGKPVERRFKLGDANVLSLPEARRLGQRTLSAVAEGRDPAGEKRTHESQPTINDLFERVHAGYTNEDGRFVDGHWADERYVRSGWGKQVRKMYNRDIKKRFGGRLANDPLDDVEDWHDAYKSRPYLGNRALAILSTMLNLGETKKYGRLRPLNSNPCTAVTKHPEPKRGVFATPANISAIGPLLIKYADENPRGIAFLYMLLFSGSRPSAIERATHEQLTRIKSNGQVWGILRGFQGKTADEVVYLPPQAMAAIDKLPRVAGRPIAGNMPHDLWYAIRKEANCEHIRMRDLRRSFATLGMSRGQAMSVISKLFNHKTTQTTDIYAKLYDEQKIEVAGAIADSMEELLRATG